jgi:hypothetical protein
MRIIQMPPEEELELLTDSDDEAAYLVKPDRLLHDAMRAVLKQTDKNKYLAAQCKLLWLLKHADVQKYLRSITREHYTFDMARVMLVERKGVRVACELLQIAANGSRNNLPKFVRSDAGTYNLLLGPPSAPRLLADRLARAREKFRDTVKSELETERRTMLHQFNCLANMMARGFEYKSYKTKTRLVSKQLPRELVGKIFDMAIGDEDLLHYPVTKDQVLAKVGFRKTGKR